MLARPTIFGHLAAYFQGLPQLAGALLRRTLSR
jgi:hypothetical protein